MDYKAKLINVNEALGASFSGGDWASSLPLQNLVDRRILSRPARCLQPGNLAASQFECALARRRLVKFVGLFNTNFSLLAKVRISFGSDAAFTSLIADTGWVPVYRRFHPSLSLDWEDPNFWTGTASEADLDLYGRHRFFLFDVPVSAQHIRVELDDVTNPENAIDIGYFYVGTNITTQFNYQRGRRLTPQSRSRRDETPSGHGIYDRRRPRRVQEVTYGDLSNSEITAFLDAGMRNDIVDPIVFVPDPADVISEQRGVFLGTFADLPAASYRIAGAHQTTLTIEEIIA